MQIDVAMEIGLHLVVASVSVYIFNVSTLQNKAAGLTNENS